jgi:hypothetical protein
VSKASSATVHSTVSSAKPPSRERSAVLRLLKTGNHRSGHKRRPGGSGITNRPKEQTISYAPWADVLF